MKYALIFQSSFEAIKPMVQCEQNGNTYTTPRLVVVSMNKGTKNAQGSVGKTTGNIRYIEDIFGRKFIYNFSNSTIMQTEFSSELKSNYSNEFCLFLASSISQL